MMGNRSRTLSIIIICLLIIIIMLGTQKRCTHVQQHSFPKGAVINPSTRIINEHEVINEHELLPVADKYYITLLSGDWRRLGNLMFSYAALLGIAESNNMIPLLKLDSQESELFDVFKISTANCSKDSFRSGTPVGLTDVYYHKDNFAMLYDNRTLHLPHRHTQLIGAYESKNYFASDHIQYKLHQEFQFRSKYMERAESFMTRLNARWAEKLMCAVTEMVVVGIHVRRGDMASDLLMKRGYTPPSIGYFRRAMAHITQLLPSKKHIVFLVSSDDITWSRKHLDQQYITSTDIHFNTDFTDTGSYVVDLAILSLCDHMIISAGSYGWWAAWLADGITIYYEDWPKPKSQLRSKFKATEFYYPDWIPLK